MKIPRLNSCCCGVSLENGSICIGVLGIFVSLLNVYVSVDEYNYDYDYEIRKLKQEYRYENDSKIILSKIDRILNGTIEYYEKYHGQYMIINVLIYFSLFVTSIILLIGVSIRKSYLVAFYIVINPLSIFISLVWGSLVIFVIHGVNFTLILVIITTCAVILVLFSYLWFVLFSICLEFKDEANNIAPFEVNE